MIRSGCSGGRSPRAASYSIPRRSSVVPRCGPATPSLVWRSPHAAHPWISPCGSLRCTLLGFAASRPTRPCAGVRRIATHPAAVQNSFPRFLSTAFAVLDLVQRGDPTGAVESDRGVAVTCPQWMGASSISSGPGPAGIARASRRVPLPPATPAGRRAGRREASAPRSIPGHPASR